MTSVVLDTNVVMSAIFFGGTPLQVLRAWNDGMVQVVVSDDVLDEYREIAARMRAKFPPVDPDGWIDYIERNATKVEAPRLAEQVCEDGDDDVFLACALASGSKIVCSGDKLLLACNGWRGIEVLTPRAFVNRLSDF